MKHPTKLTVDTDNMATIAHSIADLRYDKLAELLGALSEYLESDAGEDKNSGKEQLSYALSQASANMEECRHYIDKAWKISKPHTSK